MADVNDSTLIAQFADHHSEAAFAELVQRHIHLVYSVAFRYVGNDSDAQDVVQAVFIILARKAAALRKRITLTGWLYDTTRFTARQLLRTKARQRVRDQEAYMQAATNDSNENDLWLQLAPHIEEAMSRLRASDRELLALRFYENKTSAEAAVLLGIGVEAAHKRTARALGKMQKFFARMGINSTTRMLAGTISANSIHIPPGALVGSVTSIAFTKGTAASVSVLTLIRGALKTMAWTKAKTTIVIALVAIFAAGTTTLTVKEIVAHSPPAWQQKFDLSLLNGLPPQVKILPSLPTTLQSHFNKIGGRNGKVLAMGQSFMNLLENACQVIRSRLIVNAPVPKGKYDYILTYPLVSENMNGMEKEIEKMFGVTIRREMIETNVLIMTAQSPNVPGLRPSVAPFSNHVYSGVYSLRGATLYTLTADLEESLGTVIINETQIRGKFDIDLKWDSTAIGLERALEDKFGFKFRPELRPVEFVVVDKTR